MKNSKAGRPVNCRRVEDIPKFTCFLPEGIAPDQLESVVLSVDEVEAIRLADRIGFYQAEAAVRMQVSRQTFGRIIESAHKKIAEAIIEGKSICVEGGNVRSACSARNRLCVCLYCGFEQSHVEGVPCRTRTCPDCGKPLIRKGRCSSVS